MTTSPPDLPEGALADLGARAGAVYDPALFESVGTALLGAVRAHLERAALEPAPALPYREPAELLDVARRRLAEAPVDLASAGDEARARFLGVAADVLSHANRLCSPHYLGHQVPPPIPLAGAFEALCATTNNPSGIYEMGPFPAAAERAMVEALGARIGWQGEYDGVSTHGGSLANLTALLSARASLFPGYWAEGATAAKRGRPAVLVGADAHYSVARSAGIAGIGTDQILRLPLDDRRRVRPEAIEPAIERARASGLDPFFLVGSACSTPIGAFDPLGPMGEIAARHGLWFHVDAAHGAGLLFSRRHRGLLAGIERADSVTWDAHKMMFVPALCTFLLFRDRRASYETFNQDAPYLFDDEPPPAPGPRRASPRDFDAALRAVECTRRPMGMPVFALWAAYGPGLFEDLVDLTIGRARELHALLEAAGDFEPLHDPECNIVCFRHVPARLRGRADELSAHQADVRRRLTTSGDFYITTTKLDGASCLRVVVMNPRTERRHLEELLASVRRIGEQAG